MVPTHARAQPTTRSSSARDSRETSATEFPEKLRQNGTRQQIKMLASRSKVLETVGDTGTNSCSPVGPGGHTGCEIQVIKEARQQRQQQAEDNKPPQ